MSTSLHLTYIDYYHQHQSVELAPKSSGITIGRRDLDSHPDINLSWNHSISRQHVHIYYDYGAWYIEQLSNKNVSIVNDEKLIPGVPLELPPQTKIELGGNAAFPPTILHATHTIVEKSATGDVNVVAPMYATLTTEPEEESRRVEILARLTTQLETPDETLLERLLTEIRAQFPMATAGGIALFADRQIRVPVCFPRLTIEISFRLARQALQSRQMLRWEKRIVARSQNITSMIGVNEALYVPLLRQHHKLGLIYLHTSGSFHDADTARLQSIADMLANHPQFQMDSTHLRMPSVFLSYSHKNKVFVEQLANDLRRQRISVWWDEHLRSGKEWEKQLAVAIHQSDAFALVMSVPSLKSKYVRWEIEQANAMGKTIYPLYYEECEPPKALDRIHRIDMRENRYDDGVMELADMLYEELDQQMRSSAPNLMPVPIPTGEKIRILFLAANPIHTNQLRLGEEIRQIDSVLRNSKYHEHFALEQAWAVRPDDLRSALLRYQPHIVHFSGHGSAQGEIILEDHRGQASPVPPDALKLLFEALHDDEHPTNNVRLVLLNACYSATQAEPIAQVVGCVIGMSRAVGDVAAISFSSAFYEAVGYGKNTQQAFHVGQAQMAFFNEQETVQLLARKLDPTKLTFIAPN